jgi:hypothetical protein
VKGRGGGGCMGVLYGGTEFSSEEAPLKTERCRMIVLRRTLGG